jgi:hypothetical protein
MQPRRRRSFILVLAMAAASAASPSLAQCTLLNAYKPDAFQKGRTISLGVVSVAGGKVASTAGPTETPRRIVLERLKTELDKTKYFTSVTIVPGDQNPDGHYLLEAELAGVSGGSRVGRALVGGFGNAGQMRVVGRLLGPPVQGGDGSRAVIADWECDAFHMGGFWGLGSNEETAQKNAEAIAKNLKNELFDDIEKRLAKLAEKSREDEKKSPVKAETHEVNRKWRDKPQWEPSDYADEITSFVIEGDRERGRAIDALWMTQAALNAHNKLIPALRETAIMRANEIKRGMLTTTEPVEAYKGKDVYVFVLTFNVASTESPLIWDTAKIREATYLARAGGAGTRIAPSAFVDDAVSSFIIFKQNKVMRGIVSFWGYHPVIVTFPTKMPDGSPVVTGPNDRLELHSMVDGRPVVFTFDLKHFALQGVDDLKLAAPEATTEASR